MHKNFEKKEQEEFGPVFLVTMQKPYCQETSNSSILHSKKTPHSKYSVIAEIYP